jgi:uncharacterized protein involved in type VI secretion and phage assembly
MRHYYGIYRATVVNNIDPLNLGRITVLCPDVTGPTPTLWAMPCVPIAGKQMGTFMVPAIDSGVWVQFEAGDPDYPIWTGGWWGSGEVPPAARKGIPGDPNIVVQTMLGHHIVLSDLPGPTGGITLQSTTGAKIVISDIGITIDNGTGAKIVLTGPTVNVNSGALVVV